MPVAAKNAETEKTSAGVVVGGLGFPPTAAVAVSAISLILVVATDNGLPPVGVCRPLAVAAAAVYHLGLAVGLRRPFAVAAVATAVDHLGLAVWFCRPLLQVVG